MKNALGRTCNKTKLYIYLYISLYENLFENECIYIYIIVMAMIQKTFVNDELEIELTPHIDHKQNIWFKGIDIAQILGYHDTDDALRRHVWDKYKKEAPQNYPVKRRGIPKAIFQVLVSNC